MFVGFVTNIRYDDHDHDACWLPALIFFSEAKSSVVASDIQGWVGTWDLEDVSRWDWSCVFAPVLNCQEVKSDRLVQRQSWARVVMLQSLFISRKVWGSEARRAWCESASDDMVRISQPDKSLLLVISWTKSSSDQCAYMNICKCTQSSGFVVENFFEKIC